MEETVTNSTERTSFFSSFLELMDAREKQVAAERQLREEKYQRRTQRIYDFHELRRCLDYVSQHAVVLEGVLRGGAEGAGANSVPLGAALVRQAAALQRCMAQCVANASRIRHQLAASHRPQMDSVLAKMERELSAWTAFVQRAVDATNNSEVVIDNLQNLIAEQRRCVREVSNSSVFVSLCGEGTDADADTDTGADDSQGGADVTPGSPLSQCALNHPCSTPKPLD
ncbi:unnamed protein product [Leptidea sinapis]|uniref:Uncharacterized protein n=1 Tax=Leptidea sinapis TaxID=189913 RepID=A0A5E4PNQ9_9NEOP|nr:unnamed protein product [Leptidea sinapis]